MTACENSSTNTNYAVTVTDSENREIGFVEYPERVVALGYSNADIWHEAGGSLVGGTSDILDYEDIDIEIVGSMANVSFETILTLQPDLVLLNSNITLHKQLATKLDTVRIKYYYASINDFDDYLYTLKNFTDLTKDTDMYNLNGVVTKNKVDKIISEIPKDFNEKVLLIRASTSTFKTLSNAHFVGAMLNDLGAINIADGNNEILENISIEAIVLENPRYIFVTTMGEEEASINNFYKHINSNQLWQSVDAVKNDTIHFLPKELFQTKPNSNWGDAYEYLANILFEE